MTTLQQRLRHPKLIKFAALATAILAVSIGIGVGISGRGRDSKSSSLATEKNAAVGYASVGSATSNEDHLDALSEIPDSSNFARYYGDG